MGIKFWRSGSTIVDVASEGNSKARMPQLVQAETSISSAVLRILVKNKLHLERICAKNRVRSLSDVPNPAHSVSKESSQSMVNIFRRSSFSAPSLATKPLAK